MINPLSFENRRYLITGAASGIGRATSILLSQLGAELILLDLNKEVLEETYRELETKAYILPCDLTDSISIQSTIQKAVDEFGKIDGLAHVAGIPYIAPLKVINTEKADKIYTINQYAAIELSKAFQSKKIRSGRGNDSIVLISSVYGVVGSPANVCYAMTKASIIGITKALAIELAPQKIRVNCVAPGFVKSNMMKNSVFGFDTEYMNKLNTLHPLGLGTPYDIANTIVFLLSDMSKWTTGAVFNIDGGFTAQ